MCAKTAAIKREGIEEKKIRRKNIGLRIAGKGDIGLNIANNVIYNVIKLLVYQEQMHKYVDLTPET